MHHITNTEESGSIPSRGITFQPYEVFGEDSLKDRRCIPTAKLTRKSAKGSFQVANKRSVTADCLLRKISWQYTGGFDKASQPRIGHLVLTKLNDPTKEIHFRGKQIARPEMNKRYYSITGVYIITSFSMSDDILR